MIKDIDRSVSIYTAVLNGMTLREAGANYNITLERARQIVFKQHKYISRYVRSCSIPSPVVTKHYALESLRENASFWLTHLANWCKTT